MKNLAKCKKYKAVLNFIIAWLITIFFGFFLFVMDFFFFEEGFGLYVGFICTGIATIILFVYSIRVFVKQRKFNNSTPQYYITLIDDKTINVNGVQINTADIVDVSFKKIHQWEIFGEIDESEVGVINGTVYKWEEKIAENASKKAKRSYQKGVNKSNLGNITIKLKSSKLELTRVDNVQETVKELKSLIKENK